MELGPECSFANESKILCCSFANESKILCSPHHCIFSYHILKKNAVVRKAHSGVDHQRHFGYTNNSSELWRYCGDADPWRSVALPRPAFAQEL